MSKEIRFEMPEKLRTLLFTPNLRWRIAWGGRASAKSWSFARALIAKCLSEKKRVLCCREVQRSLRDSVHQLIRDQIKLLGLDEYFQITETEIRCPSNGSQFLFMGLASNTVTSIKSTEAIDIVWVEEANTVSKKSWELLTPTIRAKGSEIWVSMNPELETDPSYIMLIKNWHQLDRAMCIKVGWRDNPYLTDESFQEMETCKKQSYEKYLHVWEGECVAHTAANVFDPTRLHLQELPIQPSWTRLDGVDWGYAADPTVLLDMYFDESNHLLYIAHQIVEFKAELNMIPSLFQVVPNIKRCVIRADSARPEIISMCKREGFKKMLPARKWTGNHEDGIDYLRSLYDIYFHPSCLHAYHEFRTLRYKVDKQTGDIQPDTDDKVRRKIEIGDQIYDLKDDTIDAAIYGCEPLIKGFKQPIPEREAEPELDSLGRPIIPGKQNPLARTTTWL